MNPIFYILPDKIKDDTGVIEGPEAKHAIDVMRLEKGSALILVDGLGNAMRAEIDDIEKRRVKCNIIARMRHFGEPLHNVTLAAGLSTGFKFDDVIERGTELGVNRFVPLLTRKSKIKIEDQKRWQTKLNRWQKVAIASMKQTRRSYLPDISYPLKLNEFFDTTDETETLLLFDPNSAEVNLSDLEFDQENKNITIIIGPESGFEPEEIELAKSRNCKILSLGKRVLRTENASPTAITAVMYMLGELR